MAEVASLSIEVKSDSVKESTASLREMVPAASAAERAAQKWGAAGSQAGRATEEFSKKIQRTIRDLEFERQQLTRSASEQERYTALRRAGVAASSAEGRAITEHIRQLQEQRSAQRAQAESMKLAQQQAAGFATLARQRAAEEAAAAQQVAAAHAARAKALQAQQAQEATLLAKQQAAETQRRSVVQGVVGDLAFERQQLARNATERERYSALRRAGVTATSEEGRAIVASVAALQAQRAAIAASTTTTRTSVSELITTTKALGRLALGYALVQKAHEIWTGALKAADLGEQAEQIGINTDQLQAYRFIGAQAGVQTEQLDTAMTKLAKSMGAAADGGKEQIDLFQRLGVKLLDAQGELRPVAEVLPEVARGVLNIGSSSERTAVLMDLFGRSGAKMSTILTEIAAGNDVVIAKARAAGAILDTDVIAAWDRVGDALVRAQLAADTTYAKLGAPIATAGLETLEKLLKSINGLMEQINSKEGFWASILDESRTKGRIGSGPNALRLETPAEAAARRRAELESELKNPNNAGREAMIREDLARLGSRDVVSGGFYGEDMSGAALKGARAPATNALGSRNPSPKASGSDPYAKAIESAKEYILTKKAETEAVGQTVLVASRLKHEQELLNKAQNDGKVLSQAQIVELKNLAGAMAEADNALATAKFMDDAKTKSADFIAAQEMERQALFMSAEAADALRLSTEMLNEARRAGIELTPDQVDAIKQSADAMAAAKARTQQLSEVVGLGRDVFKGFFSDMREGLMNGQTVWEAFGNAAMNALNRIAEKLIEMAAAQLFEAAFPGGGSAGGGLGGLIGSIFGGGGGVAAGSGFTFAHGAAFHHGNVVPFASGGIVNSATMFPMSGRRTGVMGEAGPEAIMPLRRGPNGSLGVQMHGGAAANENTTVIVNQTVHVGEFVTTQQFASGMRNVKKSTEEGAQAALINRRKRGGLDDVFR